MSDQIKMFIAGEEVVSQNEFTINEEMLSASSTILNNCYPKSWELTKDYISNFYYPKDYSRFVIGQGEYLHGNDEYAPLKISTKNLFDEEQLLYADGWEKNNSGYYQGTVGDLERKYGQNTTGFIFPISFKENTQYTLSFEVYTELGTGSPRFQVHYTDGTLVNLQSWNYRVNTKIISTTEANKTINKITFTYGSNAGRVYIKNILLEEGTINTKYIPYGETGQYETNVEKEFDNFNIYGRTYQKINKGINLLNITATTTTTGGVTFTVNEDKSIKINGTNNTGNTLWFRVAQNFDLPAGSYTMSNGNPNVADSNGFMLIDDAWNFARKNISNATFTETKTIKPYIKISKDVTVNNQTIYPMILSGTYLEDGTNLPLYEKYGKSPTPSYPSELINVGYENLLYVSKNNITYPTTDSGFKAITKEENGVLTFNGSPTTSGGTNMYFGSFQVKESGIYRLSTNMENPPTGSSTNMILQKSTDNSNWSTLYEFTSSNGIQTTIVSLDKSMYYRLRFYGEATTIFTNTIFKPMLIKGIVDNSFIPYGKYGIEINNFGRNLFDESQLLKADNWAKNSDGYYFGPRDRLYRNYRSENGGFKFKFKFKENTQYTISFMAYSSSATGNARFEIRYTDGSGTYTSYINTTTPIRITRTSLENKTIDYIAYGYGSGSSAIDYIKDISLEEGTANPFYEEYKLSSKLYILDEPLRSLGNIFDRLYYDNGVLFVERKIGKTIINGSENWTNPWDTNSVFMTVNLLENSKRFSSATRNIICQSNYYPTTHYDGGIGSIWNLRNNSDYPYLLSIIDNGANAGKIVVKNVDYTNIDNFKSWLTTHNVEINYLLNNTTSEPLGYVDIPNSYEGINNIYINAGLETFSEIYYYWKNYDVLFAGVVKNSGDISLNPRHPHYCSLQILDYKTFLSESNTLDFVIANKTISEAISMVVNAVSGYGFIVGNIDIDSANDIIGAYSTLNKTAYDVLQYLAEISGSRWRARVVDSLTMAIDFYDTDTLPQAEDIEYTQEYWENNNIVDLTFNYGTRDYRNKQILLSDEVYANINYDETLISNGYSNTFTLQNNIGDVVSVVVDGAEKTIGTNNDKQMGVEADFYFTPGKNVIESNSVYSAGTMIHLTYQPLVKGRQIVYNNSEIDRISQQTQTDGVIARYETRNDVLSSDELEKIAKTYIEYKGKAEVILTLKTQNKDLYNIGEVVYFNAPISDLAQNYMVKSKKIEYVVINKIVNLFYIYELTSSFNNEKAINYFDNQRSKATGNIEEGESITRNVDIETQANIIWSDGSVSSATVTVTGDNVLNCALNSPFVE